MNTDLENILIEHFIFHVVHHGEDDPILMDETPIDRFELFFKLRIQEVLDGNRFDFTPESHFLSQIKSINSSNGFLDISKEIARIFHSHRDNRIKPGVMILIKARISGLAKYVLVKYDHENVIYYTQSNNKAILSEISSTFSKNKDALQKSAIIDLDTSVPHAIVVDKSEKAHVTQFFKNFLGIRRTYTNTTLTEKVKECYLETVKQHKIALPKEYTSRASLNFYEYVQNNDTFDTEDFLQNIFGHTYIPAMGNYFRKELKKKDIAGETFALDKNIPKPKLRKMRTSEGVAIQFPPTAEDTINIRHENNQTIVTITTSQLIEEK
ncbi:hypothetical protein [[Flexibacter] sp. ATCC 35208]|uniref:hypothetical protein n=1 Tax=[Flexibacter] sp. ATCC 35208 TaxID=1936242 RepID=UPI0009D415F3|nr:hypothetical protein [[Flexibacter] sp. ATCC 35208]OMP76589.1 hypothetical protein BW716_24460 [[Flexibacter] sp. ATCC 35208]